MQNIKEVLKPFFYPKSLAIIGASTKPFKFGNWQLKSLIDFGFKGEIYPINPHGVEIYGLKSYKKIDQVPGIIDLVYITVPFNKVLDSYKECIDLGIKAVMILTAGFKESGIPKAIEVERELSKLAIKTGTRIIGPNCFGVYSPEGGITLLPGQDFSKEVGSIAFISQSGGVAVDIVRIANSNGIKFSKVISYGNACDINAADLINYLKSDPKTKIVAGYFEGMNNGKDFLQAIKNLNKPLIIWKGGLTEAGSRASFSHTGFLASNPEIWEGIFKQYSNLIRADSIEEVFDTFLALQKLPPPSGRNIGVVGGGGAIGVALSDMANRYGLKVPKLKPSTKGLIEKNLILDGSNAANPVDLGNPVYKFTTAFKNIIFSFANDESIDIIINDQITTHIENDDLRALQRTLKKFKTKFTKPIIVILRQISKKIDELEQELKARKARDYYLSNNIPVYESFSRAIKAISNYIGFYERNRNLRFKI